MNRFPLLIVVIFLVLGCSKNDENSSPTGVSELPDPPKEEALSDDELMDLVQERTFKYFWDYADSNSGAARERFHPADPNHGNAVVTIGGTGFGLMSILVGIERNYISREEGVQRLNKILDFLDSADRFHGAWPHWLNGSSGKVIPFSNLDNGGDLVETAFLVQGLICIEEYFKNTAVAEQELSTKANNLRNGVEWDWYTQGSNQLYWHWSPTNGFAINMALSGYNETLVTYILAAASANHSITKEVYDNGWARNGGIKSGNQKYGLPLLVDHNGSPEYGGPLFWAHYSYLGLDPRNLSDGYVDYWEVNVNHAKINYNYCVTNPKGFKDYGKDCWGLTASYTRNNDGSLGYNAHSPSNDTGVISPTAAISSIPYTPEESMDALRFFYDKKQQLLGPAGFYDAFSPKENYWVADGYLAIDQGPIVIMLENYRSGLLWNLFMKNEDVKKGLDALGFIY